MDLPVIGPVHSYEKEFQTTDEFNMFYMKHKDELNNQTTNILNKKYRIEGFKITKIKGELCLKRFDPATDKKYVSKDELYNMCLNKINELRNDLLDKIEQQRKDTEISISEIKGSINNIIKYLSAPND